MNASDANTVEDKVCSVDGESEAKGHVAYNPDLKMWTEKAYHKNGLHVDAEGQRYDYVEVYVCPDCGWLLELSRY